MRPRLIERFRQLPYSGKILVKEGNLVQADQAVARIDYLPGTLRRVDVARQLRVDGRNMQAHLLPSTGDFIQSGDALAVGTCFGERRVAVSPYSGYLGLSSRTLGHVYLREPVPLGENRPVVLRAAEQLGVGLLAFRDCLRAFKGDMVMAGQVVATRRTGLKANIVQSPIYGQIVDISRGVITIRPIHMRTEVTAYLSGRVTKVLDGQGLFVQASAHVIEGKYGVGGESGGELLVTGKPDEGLRPDEVSTAWKGRVVVVGKTASMETINLAKEAGTRALIMGYLPLSTLLNYATGTKVIGITGDEDVAMTLILLEGFLPTSIQPRVWKTLQNLQGRFASVNGTTHIRAGVIRPEIVVCESASSGADAISSERPQSTLAAGSTVRILRGSLIGETGQVAGLPAERQVISTGSVVQVANVSIDSQVFTIPVSNLEVLPE